MHSCEAVGWGVCPTEDNVRDAPWGCAAWRDWDQVPGAPRPPWILNLGQQDELQAHQLPWPTRAKVGKDVSPPLLVGNWSPEISPGWPNRRGAGRG